MKTMVIACVSEQKLHGNVYTSSARSRSIAGTGRKERKHSSGLGSQVSLEGAFSTSGAVEVDPFTCCTSVPCMELGQCLDLGKVVPLVTHPLP